MFVGPIRNSLPADFTLRHGIPTVEKRHKVGRGRNGQGCTYIKLFVDRDERKQTRESISKITHRLLAAFSTFKSGKSGESRKVVAAFSS